MNETNELTQRISMREEGYETEEFGAINEEQITEILKETNPELFDQPKTSAYNPRPIEERLVERKAALAAAELAAPKTDEQEADPNVLANINDAIAKSKTRAKKKVFAGAAPKPVREGSSDEAEGIVRPVFV